MRKVRKLRHWKQRFNKNAQFIWRKAMTWNGEDVKPGDPIPKDLEQNKAKLRRFWESHVIELAEFEEPDVQTGQAPEQTAAEPSVLFDFSDVWPEEVELNGAMVSVSVIVDQAMQEAELDAEAWEALTDEERADKMQVAMGNLIVEQQSGEGDGEQQSVTTLDPSRTPESMVTKETDRKWHVEGVETVFPSKTKAVEAATAMLKEAASAAEDNDESFLE